MIFWLWAVGLLLLVLGLVALAFGYLRPRGAAGAQPPRWPYLVIGLVPLLAAVGVLGWMGAAPPPPAMANGAGDTALPQESELAGLLDGLEAKLLAKPDDATGWGMLGTGRLQTGRYAEAAAAFARAAALDTDNAELHSAWGEALVMADNGAIGQPARTAFARALALDPKDARARYYQAMARDADGDSAGALAAWKALLADSPADAPYAEGLRALIAERSGGPAPSAPPQSGPSAADVAAAQDMAPADRQAMIAGMVDGLEARLAADPDNLDGWLRLIRARMVLGEQDKALAALNRARAAFPSDAQALERLEAEATRAGL